MFHIAAGIILAFLILAAVREVAENIQDINYNRRIKAGLRDQEKRQILEDAARKKQENAGRDAELARQEELKQIGERWRNDNQRTTTIVQRLAANGSIRWTGHQ